MGQCVREFCVKPIVLSLLLCSEFVCVSYLRKIAFAGNEPFDHERNVRTNLCMTHFFWVSRKWCENFCEYKISQYLLMIYQFVCCLNERQVLNSFDFCFLLLNFVELVSRAICFFSSTWSWFIFHICLTQNCVQQRIYVYGIILFV